MTELERASAFEEALRERAADEVTPLPFGSAILTPSLASVWDLNLLRVDRAEVTAERLAAEAERIMGEAGLTHRRLVTLDENLAPGFEVLGWEPGRFLFMLYRGAGERTADVALVEEVDHDNLLPIREAMVREAPWADDEETVRQILAAQARGVAAGRSRHFAVLVDGKVASAADLFSDGRTAQVEDVVTQPEHRGRGYASAVVLHAVGEAQREGSDFVFLIADAEDWPKELYARLGFEAIGHKWTFLRKLLNEAP